ncbi:hypothetical protein [Bradyrhizobium sp. LB13.1]
MTDAVNTDRWIRWLNLVQLVLAGIIIMAPTVWMVAVLVQAIVRGDGLSADAGLYADAG